MCVHFPSNSSFSNSSAASFESSVNDRKKSKKCHRLANEVCYLEQFCFVFFTQKEHFRLIWWCILYKCMLQWGLSCMTTLLANLTFPGIRSVNVRINSTHLYLSMPLHVLWLYFSLWCPCLEALIFSLCWNIVLHAVRLLRMLAGSPCTWKNTYPLSLFVQILFGMTFPGEG